MAQRRRRPLVAILQLVVAGLALAACAPTVVTAVPRVSLPVPVPGQTTTAPASSTSGPPRGSGGCVMPSGTTTPVRSFPALPCMIIDTSKPYRMTVTTTKGTMEALLDPKAAPVAVNNMYFLAQEHFYEGLFWYRVQSWVIQTGNPAQGNPPSAKNVGYTFADELPPAGYKYHPGDVIMANSGANTNSSEWWIAPDETASTLPLKYTLFGRLISGLEVAQAIAALPVRPGTTYPVDPPVILSLEVTPM